MKNQMRVRPLRERGFSLMELMVVIAILGILATVVVKNVMPSLGKGKVTGAQTSIKSLKEAVTMFYMNNSRLPDSLEVLTQPDPENFNEPYIQDSDSLIDPWKTPYEYTIEGGRKFKIISLGADQMPGGADENADIGDVEDN